MAKSLSRLLLKSAAVRFWRLRPTHKQRISVLAMALGRSLNAVREVIVRDYQKPGQDYDEAFRLTI